MELSSMSPDQLQARRAALEEAYAAYKAQNLHLDMSRGKPCPEQLALTVRMLECVNERDGYLTEDGVDTRNYGLLEGIPEARRLFGDILGMDPQNVIVGGNSSLNLMYDYIAAAYAKGVCGGAPWARQGAVKFLCPVPGYDRHFAITEFFGMELIPVEMDASGPDMDTVERLVKDPLVKGIWCVPMYSNPSGITYADETVRRLARLRPAAPDFRILWDNAYCLHHLADKHDALLNIYDEAVRAGNEDIVVQFASTSKISFPGSGISAVAASPRNIADLKTRLQVETIGYDKLNMLRHIRFFGDIEGVRAHMEKHAAILRPKFDVVLHTLEEKLGGTGVASWSRPLGGYFVSVDLLDGCASRVATLLREAGVVITGAGATYPYGKDPRDRNIRLAPTYPPVSELRTAMELFCICAQLAAIEVLQGASAR